jgi:putative aldouronate transport system permease protein
MNLPSDEKSLKELKEELEKEELLEQIEKNRWKNNFLTIAKDWRLYVMLFPLVFTFFFWRYVPMSGLIIAFKRYDGSTSEWNSNFAGFYHIYDLLFGSKAVPFWEAFRNTFLLSFYGLVFGFPIPIILALFYSEIKSNLYRSVVQVLSYLPKFVSTVVVTTLTILLLRKGSVYVEPGVITNLLIKLGMISSTVDLMHSPQYFRAIYHVTGIWEGAGYGSIVYFAAIMAISPTNYEAARIDGASKMAQIRYVTLPGMASTLTIMLILRIGDLLNVGYEKVILLANDKTYSTAQVISSYVYQIGMVQNSYSLGGAADLFNAVIAMLLVLGSNYISRKVSDTSLF